MTDWIPVTRKEAKRIGWDTLDVVLITGDAYIDHPAFGIAIIARILHAMQLRVAVVPQPNWQDDLRDFMKFGKPRLFFGVTSGNMDSMVNHYTANRRLRSDDAFTPGAKAGFRPDYALTVYSQILKKLYPDVPVIIGGIEASLRRLTHYDYWSDLLKPSVLLDSKADILVYGMGEKTIREIAHLLNRGVPVKNLTNIAQTAFFANNTGLLPKIEGNTEYLYSHEECCKDKTKFAANFKTIETESNKLQAAKLIQPSGNGYVVVNPPVKVLDGSELDAVYQLPYNRLPHPKYRNKPPIPAYEMIKHSVTLHRGCFGGCSFCTISAHQGKYIGSRSLQSILYEVQQIANLPDFKGHITDLGGPTANMYQMQGINKTMCEKCKRPSCIFPDICQNLQTSHQPLLRLYKQVRELQNIKKVTIGSGIRYDLLFSKANGKIQLKEDKYLNEVMKHHVSGRLKIAPEHTVDSVLQLMRKPDFKLFRVFNKHFDTVNKQENLNLQLIPYFISAHPGCRLEQMVALALKTRKMNYRLEQVQNFTPTPMTLATIMYYTGINPYTNKKIKVEKNTNQRKIQNQCFFWYKPDVKKLIIKELKGINRYDLIQNLYKNKF